MVAVSQYPHTLVAKISGNSNLVNGVPQPTGSEEITYKCRYRPNTSAKTIKTVDGQTVVYRGTCYIHGLDVTLRTGDKVSIEGHFTDAIVLQVYKPNIRARVIL